jgi:hypothetical protein
MATDNRDRTEHSPSDPQWRWRGPRIDYDRSGEGAEARRRAQRPAAVETAVVNQKNEAAAIAYACGISGIEPLAARVIALERAMQNPLLLKSVTDLGEAYGALAIRLAEAETQIILLEADMRKLKTKK